MDLVEYAEMLFPHGLLTWQKELLSNYQNGSSREIRNGSSGNLLKKIIQAYEKEYGALNQNIDTVIKPSGSSIQMNIFDFI